MNAVTEIKIAALKRKIQVGIEELDHGRFQTYHDAKQLADEICRCGGIRLNAQRLKVAAKAMRRRDRTTTE